MSLGIWIVVLIYVTMAAKVCGFNLNTKQPIVFTQPKESYFGYSVALHSNGEGNWLLVGAPRSNSIHQPSLTSPGAVYKCRFPAGPCLQIKLDVYGNIKTDLYKEIKDNMWLGGSLASNLYGNGDVLACGHLWVNSRFPGHYLNNGACYEISRNLSFDSVKKRVPLTTANPNSQITSSGAYMYGKGLAGMSSQYTQDGKELIIGAPGVHDWRGSSIHFEQSAVRFLAPTDMSDYPDRDSYLGYAVTSGYFGISHFRYYVAGAPRAQGNGTVFIYRDVFEDLVEKSGPQLGSYFGASVCVVDLNQDGFDDLLVGAPLYKSNVFDEGRVFVYLDKKQIFQVTLVEAQEPLKGLDRPRARFGSAIASPGDLNYDGFNDVIIGAPYEDEGQGAVYVYLGHNQGVRTPFSQRLAAASITPGTGGFGFSLATGLDVDGNQYNDISVGAYKSGQTITLLVIPAVKINGNLHVRNTPINSREDYYRDSNGNFRTCAEVTVSLSYAGHAVPSSLEVNYSVHHDLQSTKTIRQDRPDLCSYGSTSLSRLMLLRKNIQNSAKISFLVQLRKLSVPVQFNLTFDLTSSAQSSLTLDPTLPRFYHGRMLVAQDCVPDIVTPSIGEDQQYIILGSKNYISLKFLFNNKGYPHCVSPTVIITPPDDVNYINVKSSGSGTKSAVACAPFNEESIGCEVGDLIPSDISMTFLVTFDSQHAITLNNTAVFQVAVGPNTNQLQVPVKTVSDMSIIGISHPNEVVIYSAEPESQKTKENTNTMATYPVFHNYTIKNHGPGLSPVTKLILAIPQTYLEGPPITHDIAVALDGLSHISSGSCKKVESTLVMNLLNSTFKNLNMNTTQEEDEFVFLSCRNSQCITYECSVINIPIQEGVIISASLHINLTTFKTMNRPSVFVQSVVILEYNGAEEKVQQKVQQVQTHLVSRSPIQSVPFPWLAVVISCAVGLLLLVILIAVLKRYGFFRRPAMEQMARLVEDTDDKVDEK